MSNTYNFQMFVILHSLSVKNLNKKLISEETLNHLSIKVFLKKIVIK